MTSVAPGDRIVISVEDRADGMVVEDWIGAEVTRVNADGSIMCRPDDLRLPYTAIPAGTEGTRWKLVPMSDEARGAWLAAFDRAVQGRVECDDAAFILADVGVRLGFLDLQGPAGLSALGILEAARERDRERLAIVERLEKTISEQRAQNVQCLNSKMKADREVARLRRGIVDARERCRWWLDDEEDAPTALRAANGILAQLVKAEEEGEDRG